VSGGQAGSSSSQQSQPQPQSSPPGQPGGGGGGAESEDDELVFAGDSEEELVFAGDSDEDEIPSPPDVLDEEDVSSTLSPDVCDCEEKDADDPDDDVSLHGILNTPCHYPGS